MFKKLAIFIAVFALLMGSADVFAGKGGYSAGDSSYSGGSKSYSADASTPKSNYSAGASTPKSNYSAGASTPKSNYSDTPKTKQPSGGFLGGQSTAQQKQASRDAYKAAQQSTRESYSKAPDSEKANVVRGSPAYQQSTVRRTITHERYVTYENRCGSFYGGYYNQPISPYYSTFQSNPTINIWFWMWLMEKADQNERSNWVYNHRSQMSDAEYQALCQKDANLEARVKQLEASGTEQNPDYIPTALQDNPDLQYNSHFVKAAADDNTGPSFGTVCLWILGILAVLGAIGGLFYLCAVKEWK